MKKKNIYLLISIIGVIIVLLGFSYAYFNYSEETESSSILSGNIYLKINDEVNNLSMQNALPMTKEQARKRNDNTLSFTIKGKNTSSKDVLYSIELNNGSEKENKTRFNPEHLSFDLVEINGNERMMLLNAVSFNELNHTKIFDEIVRGNTTEEISHTYELRMWINENVTFGEGDNVDYTSEEFLNSYATIKVGVTGNTVEDNYVKVMFDGKLGEVERAYMYLKEGDTYGELPKATRENYTFMGWRQRALPYEYQEVEYLESTGTQYIDTGYINNNAVTNIQIIHYQITELPSSSPYTLFGSVDQQKRIGMITIRPNGITAVAVGNVPSVSSPYQFATNFDEETIQINVNHEMRKYNIVRNGNQSDDYSISGSALNNKSWGVFATRDGDGNFAVEFSKIKLYLYEIIEDNDLKRYFIPCYRKSDNVAGLYDVVNGEFYTNQGTGEFVVGEDVNHFVTSKTIVTNPEDHTLYAIWEYNPKVTFVANRGTVNISSKRVSYNENYGELPIPVRDGYSFLGWGILSLPYEYQEVEYLESTGSQYIDTGVIPRNDLEINATFSIREEALNNERNYIFGCYKNSDSVNSRMQYSYSTTRLIGWGNQYSMNYMTTTSDRHYLVANKNGFFLDNVDEFSHSNSGFDNNANSIYLFGIGDGEPIPSRIANGVRIWKMIIQNNDDIVRCFTPCYRKNDNVAGLYDLVNSEFYTNQGTGEFTVGDDVDIANSDYATVVTSETIVTNPEDHTLYAIWEKNN